MSDKELNSWVLVDYARAKECEQDTFGYMCYKCGKCGRKFDHGYMVDDGGTTVAEE